MIAESRAKPELLTLAEQMVEPALKEAIDRLDDVLPIDGHPDGHRAPLRLLEAMRYALFSPGKRLRPALVLGSARAVNARLEDVLPAACAVEMVHAYSLVHDDLPSLDDDSFRRGQPSCHKKFGEATALLAGDALLTEALALVAHGRPLSTGVEVKAERRARAAAELGRSIGAAGMVGGQLDDLASGAVPPSGIEMRSIHRRKTGRLIQASCAIGAIYGGGAADAVDALRRFGGEIGLAFQLVDDALDGDGVAAIEGPEAARREAAEATHRALFELARFGPSSAPLLELARAMAERVR
jgi:geranylgeranyl diphosphate synthase type II